MYRRSRCPFVSLWIEQSLRIQTTNENWLKHLQSSRHQLQQGLVTIISANSYRRCVLYHVKSFLFTYVFQHLHRNWLWGLWSFTRLGRCSNCKLLWCPARTFRVLVCNTIATSPVNWNYQSSCKWKRCCVLLMEVVICRKMVSKRVQKLKGLDQCTIEILDCYSSCEEGNAEVMSHLHGIF